MQACLGKKLCFFTSQRIKTPLFCLKLILAFLRSLDALQFFPGLLPERNHIFYRVAVFPLELIQQIQSLFDLVKLGVVRVIGIQPPDQIGCCIFRSIIKICQLACCI